MKVLAARPEQCNVCGVCESICAETFYKTNEREDSAIRVSYPAGPDNRVTIEFCTQCGECIQVCAPQALYRANNGLVRLKKELCVGCMACVAFCPSAGMFLRGNDPVPFKCMACGKCAKSCPTDALYMTEVDIPAAVTELTRAVRSK